MPERAVFRDPRAEIENMKNANFAKAVYRRKSRGGFLGDVMADMLRLADIARVEKRLSRVAVP